MNLVTWSIHRPVPVMVLFVAMTLAGIVGFKKLGVQDRPDMDIPTVTVSVNYPGVPPSPSGHPALNPSGARAPGGGA